MNDRPLSRTAGERWLRQVLLGEVGASGQARIAAATARVDGPGLAHDVARTYALRAGFAGVASGPAPDVAPDWLVDGSARAVLAGARAALGAIREALR